MPKKIIKNWLYGAKDRLRIDYPRWLQPFLDHPNLFHLNRNSISRAVVKYKNIKTRLTDSPNSTVYIKINLKLTKLNGLFIIS